MAPKSKSKVVARADADDMDVLAAAIAQANAEKQRAEAVLRATARAEAEAEAAARAAAMRMSVREEDVLCVDSMPALVMPPALTAEPSLLRMLNTTSPTSSVMGDGGLSVKPKSRGEETERERELRMREVRVKMKLARKAYAQRRGGKKMAAMQNYAPPPVYYGDETAAEVAGSTQLVQEYVRKYAAWLTRHMKETGVMDDTHKCPEHFALLFRFDATLDPVCRQVHSKLGSQIDVLIVCYKRVLHYVWSDYADGLLAAALKKDEEGKPSPLLDVVMSPFNVVEVLPGGKRPTGLGIRVTQLEELAKMPYLNAEYYPRGIPAELVLKDAAWGSDLAPETAAERAARMMSLADEEGALDSDSDDEVAAPSEHEAMANEIKQELKAIGPTRFPFTQTILNAFRPDYEAIRAQASDDAQASGNDAQSDEAQASGDAHSDEAESE